MSKEENIKTQERWGDAVNNGNLEAINELAASDVVDHDPAPDQGSGPGGFIQFFENLRSAFPDLSVEVDHMVADEDNVAIAYKISGTHKGNFNGVSPTGRRITARGMQIARFDRNGRMVERWGSSDELGILKQIGAAPTQS